jgi:hypothetical protein
MFFSLFFFPIHKYNILLVAAYKRRAKKISLHLKRKTLHFLSENVSTTDVILFCKALSYGMPFQLNRKCSILGCVLSFAVCSSLLINTKQNLIFIVKTKYGRVLVEDI